MNKLNISRLTHMHDKMHVTRINLTTIVAISIAWLLLIYRKKWIAFLLLECVMTKFDRKEQWMLWLLASIQHALKCVIEWDEKKNVMT